jgi:hypothetical protein
LQNDREAVAWRQGGGGRAGEASPNNKTNEKSELIDKSKKIEKLD